MQDLIIPFASWNILTFLLMGIDKYKSVKGHWRVRESTLLAAAFAMGGLGCLAGSLIFRHKTRKPKFQILLPLAALINLAVVFLAVSYN